jgi:peptide/nickel transport system permease protein
VILFVLKRLLWAVPVLLGAATLAFLLMQLTPGDTVDNMLAGQPSQPALEAELREQFHLDRPAIEQYALYLEALAQGDFGYSMQTGRSVTSTLSAQLVETLKLTGLATAAGVALGFLGGITGSWVKRRSLDTSVNVAQMVAVSMPSFWVGLLLLTAFSFNLRWFPVAGNEGWRSIVLPALTLMLPLAAVISQLVRSGMLLVLQEPYIVTARAKGVSEWTVRFRHALRNAVLPTLSYAGVVLGTLVTGAVVAETIFSRQGLGRVVVTAVTTKDLPVVMAVVVLAALLYVVINIAVDVLHAALDPRIR